MRLYEADGRTGVYVEGNTMRSLLAAAVAVLALAGAGTALADANFSDPAGDSGGAPDIGDVVVLNDAFGEIVFLVELKNVADKLAADQFVEVAIDSDRNGDTGENGWDYVFSFDGSDQTGGLGRWNGTEWDYSTPQTTVDVAVVQGVAIFVVNKSDLGDTGSFDFYVWSQQYSGEQELARDDAPDGDQSWSYAVVAKKFGIGFGKPTSKPVAPVAGKRFAVSAVVGRTDSIAPVEGAKVTCKATVGGKPVAARGSFKDEVATCTLTPPKKSKGKLLKLTITATYNGATATKTVSAKVK